MITLRFSFTALVAVLTLLPVVSLHADSDPVVSALQKEAGVEAPPESVIGASQDWINSTTLQAGPEVEATRKVVEADGRVTGKALQLHFPKYTDSSWFVQLITKNTKPLKSGLPTWIAFSARLTSVDASMDKTVAVDSSAEPKTRLAQRTFTLTQEWTDYRLLVDIPSDLEPGQLAVQFFFGKDPLDLEITDFAVVQFPEAVSPNLTDNLN